MRLGVIHWAFPPIGGGVETHLLTILPEMVRQGEEVYLLTATVEGVPSEEVVNGVKIKRCNEMMLDSMIAREKNGEHIYNIAKTVFGEFVDSNKIKCVQVHNLHLDVYELSRALTDVCQERKIPVYLVIHNERFYDRPEELMWRILFLPWTKLVPISQYVSRTLKSRQQIMPEDKWEVILHGIDLDRFKVVAAEEKERLKKEYGFENRQVIALPARILPTKGCLEAIKGMAYVKEKFPDALLVLTGGVKVLYDESVLSKYNKAINSAIEQHELKKNVHIAADYNYGDIPNIVALSDVVTYPTRDINESFGLGPVEGMAGGRPCVVTRSGGLVESVIDGETGFIISKEAEKIPVEWAEKVCFLLANPGIACKMGKKGRERVEKIFDKKRMAKDFVEMSKRIIRDF